MKLVQNKKTECWIFVLFVVMILMTTGIYTMTHKENQRIPDYTAAYVHDGQVEFSGTDEPEEAMNQCYEAGSIGKTITAYLCLQLVQEGKLQLDDQIIDYLDSDWVTADPRFSKITVRDLLSHQAGFSPSFEFGVDKKIYFEPGSRFSYSGVGYIYLQKVIEKASGMEFEQAAQKYVFWPLGMNHSTFLKKPTMTPYLSSASFVLYTGVPWILFGLLLFGLGCIFRFIWHCVMKHRDADLQQSTTIVRISALFYGSIAISFLLTFILLEMILPRMLLPMVILGVCMAILLFTARNIKIMKYAAVSGIFIWIIWGLTAGTVLPIGPVLTSREPNAAYSLVTNTEDMSFFMETLLKESQTGSETMREMFRPQIKLDDQKSWGAGLGIEQTKQMTCCWHSGINPGMQSLMVLCPEQNQGIIILTNSDYGLEFAKEQVSQVLRVDGDWEIPRE